jgi:hypothetical protein
MQKQFGSIEKFCSESPGIDAVGQQALREHFQGR